MIHDTRGTLTPSLSRSFWLIAVLIMANINATDTHQNDTPMVQHVCYGVHGGTTKHLKGAARHALVCVGMRMRPVHVSTADAARRDTLRPPRTRQITDNR